MSVIHLAPSSIAIVVQSELRLHLERGDSAREPAMPARVQLGCQRCRSGATVKRRETRRTYCIGLTVETVEQRANRLRLIAQQHHIATRRERQSRPR